MNISLLNKHHSFSACLDDRNCPVLNQYKININIYKTLFNKMDQSSQFWSKVQQHQSFKTKYTDSVQLELNKLNSNCLRVLVVNISNFHLFQHFSIFDLKTDSVYP